MNYFLKLLCLFIKHKQCQVDKIDQLLTINYVIKNLNNRKLEVSTKASDTCQQSPLYPLKLAKTALYTIKLELLELGGGIAAKNGWEGWAHLVLP